MSAGIQLRRAAGLLLVMAFPVWAQGPSQPVAMSAGVPPAIGSQANAVAGIEPRLATAAEQALRTHPAISAGERSIRAAQHDIKAARWLRFPSVSVQAMTRDDRLGAVTPEIDVIQPIWTGGRINRTIDRAKAAEGVAEAHLAETALDILLRLSDAYYEIARTARLSQLFEESLQQHQRLVESMERRVAQEVSPQSDLELARGRTAQVSQELGLVVAQHQSALRRFYELVGDEKFDLGAVPIYSPTAHHQVSQASVDRAQTCHPTVRRLNAEVDLAEAERRISRAQILPQVGLQYSYDRFGGNQVGLAVRAQTNGGLSPIASAEAAGARKQASEYALSSARLEIRETVGLDLVQNQSAKARIGATAEAAESTANVTESFLRQFVAGRRTWLDVMNSVREAVTARAQMIEVETNAMSSSARIHLRACDWFSLDQGQD